MGKDGTVTPLTWGWKYPTALAAQEFDVIPTRVGLERTSSRSKASTSSLSPREWGWKRQGKDRSGPTRPRKTPREWGLEIGDATSTPTGWPLPHVSGVGKGHVNTWSKAWPVNPPLTRGWKRDGQAGSDVRVCYPHSRGDGVPARLAYTRDGGDAPPRNDTHGPEVS